MKRLSVMCLAMASLILASCASELTPYEHIARAQEYLAAGQTESAILELKNAAQKDPNNMDARYELAVVSLLIGDGASAEKEARRAEELGISERRTVLLLAKALYLQGEFDRLIAETEPDKLPENLDPAVLADIVAYRAHAMIQQQQFRLADAEIERALGLNEDSIFALLARASYEAQVGRRETAMELAQRAVELDPASSDAWMMLGDLQAADDDLPAARAAYDNAVAHRRYVSLATAKRAFIAAQQRDFDAAENDLALLFESGYKDHPYVNFVRGYAAFQQGDFPMASQTLEVSVAGNPQDPLSKLYLVASYTQEGKLEQAQMIANQLYFDIPNSVEIARLYASVNMEQQDFDTARGTLEKVLEAAPDDPVALGMLGSIALLQGNGDEAVGYFQRLSAVSPENPDVRRMLNLAQTMRGDFVSELSLAAEKEVSEEEFDQVLLSAAVALQQGQLREAVTIAENLQQQYPDRVEPLNMLASIYLSSGDWRRGKSLLEKTLELQPLEPSATKSLAKILLAAGEPERAEELISAYLRKHPRDQEAIGVQAQVFVATRPYAEAAIALGDLADQYPEDLEIRARLAQLQFDNGQFEQVLARTEVLSEEEFKSQPLLIELRGKSLYNLGDADGAARLWDRWVKAVPGSVLANFFHADALVRANDLERAVRHLETVREIMPEYLPARLLLVRTLALKGDMDDAQAQMQALQSEMREERPDVLYTQGWLASRTGDFAAAEQAFRKTHDMQPAVDSLVLLVVAINSQDRADEGLALLEQGQEQFPRDLAIPALLGQTYMARDELDKAESVYKRMLDIDPQSVLALNNLAWLNREKNFKLAMEYANQGIAVAPEDPYLLSTLGTLMVLGGQRDEGEQTLRKAVALHPDNFQIKLSLARLLLDIGKQDAAKPYLDLVIESSGNDALAAEAEALLKGSGAGG